jgi:formate C-acetyltransferase
MISDRIAKLRQQSMNTKPAISSERAELMTKFHQEHPELMSAPRRRALSFKYLMENKAIHIGEGELIVGEKGPSPMN